MSDTTGSNRADIIARAGHAATLTLADLEVGQSFSIEHCFGSDEVDAFAALTGDYSPLHVDPDYAAGTEFGDRIVHGMLLASLFSTLVGMKIPGRNALYLGQELNFRRPVVVGEPVVATSKITSINRSLGVIQLATSITKADDSIAVSGSGKVKVRDSAAAEDSPVAADVETPAPTGQPVALVTGASRGIGAAIARRLAGDGFGVAINFRTSEQDAARVVAAIQAGGGVARAVQADLRDGDAVNRMIMKVRDSFGGLDLLVNNAALGYEARSVMNTAWSDIADHLDVSVRAPLTLCRAGYEMLKDRRGAIVNIISQVVEGTPPRQMLDYVIGKYGLLGLTRALAVEWAGDGIRVNGIAPSLIETDMTSHFKDRAFKLEANRTPLRRLAAPEDVAAAVSYLGGKDAAFLTGLVLPVSGGQVMK